MASLMDSPITLKDKLSQVKHLLKDANERLQEEASKYGIFATKTSAAGQQPIAANLGKQCNGSRLQDVPMDLRRTINDISTIQSVLHCPVFNQIVNVTDSLSKLSHHVDLRPSIGPSDINFNANGELILKPPLEPTSFTNSIESRLNEYSDNSKNSPQAIDQEYIRSNSSLNGFNGFDVEQNLYNEQQHQLRLKQNVGSYQVDDPNLAVGQVDGGARLTNIMDQSFENTSMNGVRLNTYLTSNNGSSPHQDYDTEKLVMNINKSQLASGTNNIRNSESKVAKVAAVFEANATPNEGRRLYKANGHQALNKMVPNVAENFATTNTIDQVDQYRNLQGISYTNEMYNTTQDLGCTVESSSKVSNNISNESYAANSERVEFSHNGARNDVIDGGNNIKKLQIFQNPSTGVRPNGASPSTSDGSTVKLADECDSGTSSFSSQPIKGAFYSPNSQRSIKDTEDDGLVDSSIDQELIEKLSPEMERVKVTLEKDQNGLGITIAGYALQRDEISGIFIKSITPGSPADRSGKIKILDQIFAVNGLEIINFSNPQAVHVMREQKGRVVTLELMRYLAESKKKKLQTLLDKAVPSSTMDEHATSNANNINNDLVGSKLTTATVLEQYYGGQGPPKSPFNNGQIASDHPDAIYKNTSIFKRLNDDLPPSSVVEGSYSNGLDIPENFSQSQMPIAAQRGAVTSKIIETKQGARNTIEIRSPMCQTTATYVNKLPDHIDQSPAKQLAPTRLPPQQQQQQQHHQQQPEASEDLSFGQLMKSGEPEWEKDVKILELYKEPSQSLGFTVKEYANPKDRTQSIIMITSLSPGGIAELDGRLSFGDLLKFVDDTNLEGASLAETVKALKRTCGQVRLGVLKLKRS